MGGLIITTMPLMVEFGFFGIWMQLISFLDASDQFLHYKVIGKDGRFSSLVTIIYS